MIKGGFRVQQRSIWGRQQHQLHRLPLWGPGKWKHGSVSAKHLILLAKYLFDTSKHGWRARRAKEWRLLSPNLTNCCRSQKKKKKCAYCPTSRWFRRDGAPCFEIASFYVHLHQIECARLKSMHGIAWKVLHFAFLSYFFLFLFLNRWCGPCTSKRGNFVKCARDSEVNGIWIVATKSGFSNEKARCLFYFSFLYSCYDDDTLATIERYHTASAGQSRGRTPSSSFFFFSAVIKMPKKIEPINSPKERSSATNEAACNHPNPKPPSLQAFHHLPIAHVAAPCCGVILRNNVLYVFIIIYPSFGQSCWSSN